MAVASSSPSSRVELSISCANLMDKDVFSKSDPMAVVYVLKKTGFVEVSYLYILLEVNDAIISTNVVILSWY